MGFRPIQALINWRAGHLAVVGGLLSSTILSLFLVPVTFSDPWRAHSMLNP